MVLGCSLCYFIKSAMVTLSRYSFTRRFSSRHMGSVRQSAVRLQSGASHSRQATGAKSPSVSRRMSLMRYASGFRVRR